jgi:hypothetical protein
MKEITMKNNHEIHEDDAKNMETLKEFIIIYLNPNSFDPDGLKIQINHDLWKEKNQTFRSFFSNIINTRGIPEDEYNDISDEYFPPEDRPYEYLKIIYSFLYEDGSKDAIYDAWKRARAFYDL